MFDVTEYPRMGHGRHTRKERPITNSFRLAMNRDGTMSVVSGVPIITSHFYDDNITPQQQQQQHQHNHYRRRQVRFNPGYQHPRYVRTSPVYAPPQTLYPVVDIAPRVTDHDDAVSVTSTTSDMSESELRPSRLSVRRSIALVCAWICLVRLFRIKHVRFNMRMR